MSPALASAVHGDGPLPRRPAGPKNLYDYTGCSIESEIRRYTDGSRLRLQGRSFPLSNAMRTRER